MKSHLMQNTADSFFSAAWFLYETSFPENEKRNLAQQKQLFTKKEYTLFAVVDTEKLIGFLSTWNLGTFVFIEHFAVVEELRGKGFGTKILATFLSKQKQYGKDIVLDTERPNTNPVAKRRIAFYERVGFNLCLENYIQPPYHADKKSVPLYLMRFGKEISKEEFEEIKRKMYLIVYEVTTESAAS